MGVFPSIKRGGSERRGVSGEGEGRGVLTPVERDFIFKLTDEMKLGMTGLVEPKTIQQVGKFSGASYVLVGTVQKIGKDIQLNSRLVKTETSKVEKAVEVTLKGTPEIFDLLSQEIKTPLIPVPEETPQEKLMKIEFQRLREEYSKLQDESYELLKQKLVQAKDEKSKAKIQKQINNLHKKIIAMEYRARASIALDLKDYNSTREYFNKSIELEPSWLSYTLRADFHKKMSEIHLAIFDYTRAIELNPKIAGYFTYQNRGRLYMEIGDYPKAVDDFTESILCNRDNSVLLASGHFDRGVAYGEMGDHVRAISDFNKVIELSPENAQAYANRGLAYYKRGQISAAKRDFQKACDLGLDSACDTLDRLQR